jgi:hypothetical protein
MTPEQVFADLMARVGAHPDSVVLVNEQDLADWPPDVVAALRAQGLLRKARDAASAVCPGCEQQCIMPVNTVKDETSRRGSFVVCDKRSDINRVPIPPEQLRQWRTDAEAVRRFVADSLSLRQTGERSREDGLTFVGVIQGTKRSQMLALRVSGDPALVVGGGTVPLCDLAKYEDGRFGLDAGPARKLADTTTTDPRHMPTNARREARKLDTRAMYEGWQRQYRELRKEHPDKSDSWCAQRIAASSGGRQRDAETIRKHMTK